MHTVVNKLQDKAECLEKSNPTPKQNSVLSTIPENAINTVRSHNVKTDNAKQKACLFCGSPLHIPSLCPLFLTVESRRDAYHIKFKKHGCKNVLLSTNMATLVNLVKRRIVRT